MSNRLKFEELKQNAKKINQQINMFEFFLMYENENITNIVASLFIFPIVANNS